MLTRMAPLMTRMARMLTRMTRWHAGSHYYTHSCISPSCSSANEVQPMLTDDMSSLPRSGCSASSFI